MNHARIANCTRVRSKKWRRQLWGLVFDNSFFLSGVYEVCMQNTPQRRQRRGSSRPVSLLRSTDAAESRCRSSKTKCRVKLTSRFRHGGLKLVRFVLQSTSIYSPSLTLRWYVRVSPCVRLTGGRIFTQCTATRTGCVRQLVIAMCAWLHNLLRIPAYWK